MFCFVKCSHSFVDVYLNRKWRVVDPATKNIGIGYYWPLNRKFVIYKKGWIPGKWALKTIQI